jgi:hypothetical protein
MKQRTEYIGEMQMKTILQFRLIVSVLCFLPFIAQSQSTMEFQLGTTIEVTAGGDICADDVIINGIYSGGGTKCGGALLVENEDLAPLHFALEQNYPNPFNPSTTISFSLPSISFVSLKIFDLLGREVATVVSEEMSAGKYTKQWNANGMPSGIYYFRLQAGSFSESKKLVLLR